MYVCNVKGDMIYDISSRNYIFDKVEVKLMSVGGGGGLGGFPFFC